MVDATRTRRRFVAGAWSLALALSGCSLNPQPDDPGFTLDSDPGGNAGTTSGMGGSTNYGGLPGMVPPPFPGAGGAATGTSDGGIGGPIISPPQADAGAHGDAGPTDHTDAGDAGDAGDARPDRDPTRD